MDSKYINARRFFWCAMLLAIYILLDALCDAGSIAFQYTMQTVKHSYLISLAAAWGTSLQRRILHKRIRHYLLHVDGSILIWITIRSLKFYVFDSPITVRNSWYAYYIPQLLMAYFAYAVTSLVGKSENEKLPKSLSYTLAVTVAFIVAIMSNDLHGLAYYIDPVTGAEQYRIIYYLAVAWIIGLIIAAIYRVPKHKDEGIPARKIIWPYVVFFAGMAYCILYTLPATKDFTRRFEYTITICVMAVIFWEYLIQSGFIQANSDYEWCFQNSTIRCQILDAKGNRIYQSLVSRPMGEDDWYRLRQYEMIKPDSNTEMLLARIRGGFVVWEKDIHDINRAMDNLLDARENIRSATIALQETIEEEIKANKIKEQNRLYDKVSAGVGPKFEVLAMCIKFAQHSSGNELNMLIRRIDIMGVYAKRKSNLILLSEKSDANFNVELGLCFKETFDNLNQGNVEANYRLSLLNPIGYIEAGLIYDLLELTLEATLDEINSITAIVAETASEIILTVSMNCVDTDAGAVVIKHIREKMEYNCEMYDEQEDENVNVSFLVSKKGGEKV